MGFRRLLGGRRKDEDTLQDVNKNSFANRQREGDGECKYKGVVGRVSSKLAQLLRHCIRLSVKVHPEGGLVVVGFPPNLLRISGVLCCLPALFFHTWCSTLLMNRKQAYSQRQTRH